MASIFGMGTSSGSSGGILGHRKGGSSAARAARARKAHKRRQFGGLAKNRAYKGGRTRQRASWII